MFCNSGRCVGAFALALLLAIVPSRAATAGGGPENLLLVVNARSQASLTVANHYVRLRRIPPSNVVHLDWTGSVESTDVDTFRTSILKPVLQAVTDRGLDSQIDYVIYSAGFPYRVDFAADLQGQEKLSARQVHTSASITGLTYLAQLVMTEKPLYAALTSNQYMAREVDGKAPTRGFRASDRWDDQGQRTSGPGRQYLLSTMLGATTARGNTVSEIVRYLEHSKAADGTRPTGAVYYMRNSDIRTKTRQSGFDAAVRALNDLKVRAEIVDGDLPQNKNEVIGLMAGVATFDWPASRSTILPGAICEHLTSYGGILSGDPGQTSLAEFLRGGAAGSSGTVIEPFAIGHKFPHPMIHVHYARGCNLAEAFYQSVFGPYQLLIVGDPLCSPWGRAPEIDVAELRPGQRVQGTISFRPEVAQDSAAAKRFVMFVDGVRTATCKSGESLELDTTSWADGHHEIRVVAIADDEIETQGRKLVDVVVDNHGRSLTFSVSPGERNTARSILLVAETDEADEIRIFHNSRLLGTIKGGAGVLRVPRVELGAGPATLRAVAIRGTNTEDHIVAPPLELELPAATTN